MREPGGDQSSGKVIPQHGPSRAAPEVCLQSFGSGTLRGPHPPPGPEIHSLVHLQDNLAQAAQPLIQAGSPHPAQILVRDRQEDGG